jgi:hypothetical protein
VCNHETPARDDDILLIDSAVDISCIGKNSQTCFTALEQPNKAWVGDSVADTFYIVTAATVVIDCTTSRTFKIYQLLVWQAVVEYVGASNGINAW